MKNFLLYLLLLGTLVGGCAKTHSDRNANSPYTSPISTENIRANMEFLASDELEGRDTATKGGDLAALYIKSELKKYGVGVLKEIGSYYQEVGLVRTIFDKNSQIMLLNSDDKILAELEYLKDFVGSSRTFPAIDTVTNLVFAGFGISAEEFNYNDYDSLDVTGKFVLVWPGEPVSEDTAFFAGEEDTKYASLFTKVSNAKKQGAFGIFLVSKMEEKYGWESLVNYTSKGGLSLKDLTNDKNKSSNRIPRAYLKTSSLETILNLVGQSYDSVAEIVSSGKPIPRFELDTKVKVSFKFNSDSSVITNNVIGYFEGNDPVLKNEIVAIGAHYDHVGGI